MVEDEEGAFLEGILALGWDGGGAARHDVPDAILAISDLAAVAIRQARLRNSAWERSDHADRLLHTDRLTGLANRVTFERMLELEIARATRQGTPLAVVLLDVDGLSGISRAQGRSRRGRGAAPRGGRHRRSRAPPGHRGPLR